MLLPSEVITAKIKPYLPEDRDKFLSEDMIHPNEAGVKLLGRAVACAIKECPVSEKKHFEAKTRKIAMCEKTIQ